MLRSTMLVLVLVVGSTMSLIVGSGPKPVEARCGQMSGVTRVLAPSTIMRAWGRQELTDQEALAELVRTYRGDQQAAQASFRWFENIPLTSSFFSDHPATVGGSIDSPIGGRAKPGKAGSPPGQEKGKGGKGKGK